MIAKLRKRLSKPKTLAGILETFSETIAHLNELEERHSDQIKTNNARVVELMDYSNRLGIEMNRARNVAQNLGELIA